MEKVFEEKFRKLIIIPFLSLGDRIEKQLIDENICYNENYTKQYTVYVKIFNNDLNNNLLPGLPHLPLHVYLFKAPQYVCIHLHFHLLSKQINIHKFTGFSLITIIPSSGDEQSKIYLSLNCLSMIFRMDYC